MQIYPKKFTYGFKDLNDIWSMYQNFQSKKEAPTEVQKLHRTRKYMGKKIWMYRPFTSGRDCQQAYKYFKVNA